MAQRAFPCLELKRLRPLAQNPKVGRIAEHAIPLPTSDIDAMVISDRLTYADLFAVLEEATGRLGRKVNPTVYAPAELARRIRQSNAFVRRVLAQPKIWLIGAERDLAS